jgi:SAM-dependent methyltransferase
MSVNSQQQVASFALSICADKNHKYVGKKLAAQSAPNLKVFQSYFWMMSNYLIEQDLIPKAFATDSLKEGEVPTPPCVDFMKDQIATVPCEIGSYLDYGGGNGYKSEAIAKLFGLEHVDVIDVQSHSDREGVSFHASIDDRQYDLVTCMHVLHHVVDLDLVLTNLSKLVRKEGVLYIREHNCENDFDRTAINFEHWLYEADVKNKPTSYDHMMSQLGTGHTVLNYMSCDLWVKKLEAAGFVLMLKSLAGNKKVSGKNSSLVFQRM